MFRMLFLGGLVMWMLSSTKTKVDNTVKESKNNTVMKMMSWLLLQKGLQLTGLLMSRVGHTHSTLGILPKTNPMHTMVSLNHVQCQHNFQQYIQLRSSIWFTVESDEMGRCAGWWLRHRSETYSANYCLIDQKAGHPFITPPNLYAEKNKESPAPHGQVASQGMVGYCGGSCGGSLYCSILERMAFQLHNTVQHIFVQRNSICIIHMTC